jgi:hypothetical protein
MISMFIGQYVQVAGLIAANILESRKVEKQQCLENHF